MCFTISPLTPDAKIAKKDKKVYKLLLNAHFNKTIQTAVGSSPFFTHNWQSWNTKTSSILVYNENRIEDGLHACSSLKDAKEFKENYHLWPISAICECIIPKGAMYYINKNKGEIVSNQMLWTGRIYHKDRFKLLNK